jgi:hypothetical protein
MRKRLGGFFRLSLAKRCQLGVNNARVFAGLGEKQVEFALPMPKQNHDCRPCLICVWSSEAVGWPQPALFLGICQGGQVIPSRLGMIQALPWGLWHPRLEFKE